MIRIDTITTANAHLFRHVRLRALQDSPTAFGSTFAREAAFEDGDWALRVQHWNGEQGIGFLAVDDTQLCGIAGALLEEQDRAQLVSVWTAPEYRQRGTGRLLVQAVINWAVSRGV
jgi:GNAT superfamily N-acetyltransferase